MPKQKQKSKYGLWDFAFAIVSVMGILGIQYDVPKGIFCFFIAVVLFIHKTKLEILEKLK